MPTCSLTAEALARELEAFLLEAPHAVLIENGDVLFDFSTARYSVSGEGKCVLHVWSEERNIVRRVLDFEFVLNRTLVVGTVSAIVVASFRPSLLCMARSGDTASRAASWKETVKSFSAARVPSSLRNKALSSPTSWRQRNSARDSRWPSRSSR